MRLEFDGIPANSLSLWKVSVHFNQNLKKEVGALNLDNGDSLQPLETLLDNFSSDLERKSVHIIFDRRYSGKLQFPSTHLYFLSHEVTLQQCNKLPLLIDLFFGRHQNEVWIVPFS